jgi:starvation-inducible DNA-binding protein
MKPTFEILDKDIEEVVIALNTLLADEYVLYTKIRNMYWNYSSPNYYELHKFLKIQYELLDEMVNNIVKRVHSLGYFALGTMKDFLDVARLSEENDNFDHSTLITKTLVTDHETVIEVIRKEIIPLTNNLKDLITADLVTGIMEQHEKMAWMLSSFISEPGFSATKHIRTIAKRLIDNQEINIEHHYLNAELEI